MENTVNSPETQCNNMKPKKKSIALILCLLGGPLGAHKFYEGKILMGLLYLCTFGIYFVGVIIDLIKLIRSPSMYYVEKRDLAYYKNAAVSAAEKFPLDKIGRIVSGAGGAVIGYGVTAEFNWTIILIGLGVAVAGIFLTWLKTQDIKDTLVGNGIIIALLAVGVFALLFLIGAVIIYVAARVFLGVDLIEWGRDLFGSKKESGRNNKGSGTHEKCPFPEYVYDEQGNQYRLEHYNNEQAEYQCPANGTRKHVWIHDLQTD